MRLRVASLLGAGLCFLLSVLPGCNADAVGDEPTEDIEGTRASLAEQRTVQIDSLTSSYGLRVGSQRVSVSKLNGMLVSACIWELADLVNSPSRSASFPFAAAATQPANESVWLDTWSLNSQCDVSATIGTGRLSPPLPQAPEGLAKEYKGWAVPWLWSCMADFALSVAESPSGSAIAPVEDDPRHMQVLAGPSEDAIVRIPAPSASDRASWYLLAADYHRVAATQTAALLDRDTVNVTCPNTVWTDQFATSSGDITSVGAVIAGTLANSTQRMLEAAEKAQQYIVAAAEARAGEADIHGATTQVWRAATDSRLEGINAYAPVDPRMFEGRGTSRLYRLTHTDGKQTILTTAPDLAPAGFGKPAAVDAWVAQSTVDGATWPLITWRSSANEYVTFANSAATETNPPTGHTFIRREGYVYATTQTGTKQLVVKSGGPANAQYHYAAVTGEEIPTIYTANYAGVGGFVFTAPRAGDLPVYTDGPLSDMDVRAEEVLRTYRINPFNPGATLATQLLAALNERYRVGTTGNPLGTDASKLVQSLFDTSDTALGYKALESAAKRIVLKSQVLGQPLVPIPNTSNPVRYTVADSRDTFQSEPVYQYARTTGRTQVPHLNDGVPNGNYGIQQVLDYVRRTLIWRLSQPVGSMPQQVFELLGTVNGLVSTFTDRDFSVRQMCDTNNCSLSLQFGPGAPTTAADVKSLFDVWVGTAGLSCALHGHIEGMECDPNQHRFAETNFTYVAPMDTSPFGIADMPLVASTVPPLAYGQTSALTSLPADVPLFLTRRTAEGRHVPIFGFYPERRGGSGYPLMGPGLQQAFAALMAPDPESPGEGALSCAGVPRNAKVLLEDELIDVPLEDAYDQSFRYYLQEARRAADEADALGREVVAQGLTMDLRAEAALEQLEELCGGSIDLGVLESYACQTAYKCDLVALLKDPNASLPAELQNELAGARACLGVSSGSEPIWVAVGDQPLCAWQYAPGGQPSANARPCGPCPQGVSCPDVCPRTFEGDATANRCEWTDFPNVVAVPITDTLGVAATRRDFYANDAEDDRLKWLMARYIMELGTAPPASLGIPDPDGAIATQQWEEWVTDHRLSPVAQQLGYFEDFDLTYAVISKGGDAWLDLEQLFQAWDTKAAAGVDPYLGVGPTHDGAMPWPCGPIDKRVAEQCDALGMSPEQPGWPLLCGRMCGVFTAGASHVERTNAIRLELATRLTQAIDALKNLTGESSRNVVRVHSGVTIEAEDLAPPPAENRDPWAAWRITPPAIASRPPVEDQWARAFLFGDFEYAGATKGVPYYVGTPPVETGSLQARCFSNGSGLGCSYLGSPEEVPAPPGVWADELCVRGQSISDTSTGPGSSVDTDTSYTDTGCGAVRQFLEGGSEEIAYARETVITVTETKWCVPLYREIKVDRPFKRWDSKETRAMGDRFTACFAEKEEADSWKAEVEAGALQALAGGSMPACGTAGALPANGAGVSGQVCAVVGTLDPLGVVNAIGTWLKDKKTRIRAYDPERRSNRESTPETVSGKVEGPTFLDALSLAHLALIQDQGTCDTLWAERPIITSIADFSDYRKKMECTADRVELQLSRMALGGVPRDLLDALRDASKASVDLAQRGEYGENLLKLVTATQNFGRQRDVVVQAIRNLALEFDMGAAKLKAADLNIAVDDIDGYINALEQGMQRRELDSIAAQGQINRLRLRQSIQSIAHQSAMAAAGAIPSFSCGLGEMGCSVAFSPGAMAQSGIQAIHSGQMIGIESAVGALQGDLTVDETMNAVDRGAILSQVADKIARGRELNEIEKQVVLIELEQRVLEKADLINEAATSLNESYGSVQTILADIAQTRANSRRAAAKALLLESDELGKQYNVNITMRATMNTLKVRYERARDAAVRSAYLARRAIEQKIGMDLSTLTSDVGWVEAPSKWADSVCTLSGINYEEIRRLAETGEASEVQSSIVTDENGRHYADAFIGEYVSKLEQFVEAYRSQYPFQDASDSMVVSLRDELLGIRASCEVPGVNMLYQSGPVVGEAWLADCDAISCVRAEPQATGPFQCTGTASALAAGNEASPCDTIGGSASVDLSYQRTTAGSGVAGTFEPPPASYYDVLDLPGIHGWVRPESCQGSKCTAPTATIEGAVVLSGNTMPTVNPHADGSVWLNFDSATDKLEMSGSAVAATYTVQTVLATPASGQAWTRDTVESDGKVTRLSLFANASRVYFVRTTDALGTPAPVTASSAVLANGPHVVTVRRSAFGFDAWVDGVSFAQWRAVYPQTGTLQAVIGSGSRLGEIGETIVFNRAISLTEASIVERYLADKFGVALANVRPQVTDGLRSWLRGDFCRASPLACEDLAQSSNTFSFMGSPTLVTSGIGGKHALQVPSAASGQLAFTGEEAASDTMTLMAVIAPERWTGGANYPIAQNTAMPGGWQMVAGQSLAVWADWLDAEMPNGDPIFSVRPTKANNAAGIVTLRVSASVAELMLDGVTVARALVPPGQPVNLGLLPYSFGVLGKTAELLVYDRALSGSELAQTHAYLSQRYGISVPQQTERPAYLQTVDVGSGWHWLSWYEKTTCNQASAFAVTVSGAAGGPKEELIAYGCQDASTMATTDVGKPSKWLRSGWSRRFGSLSVETPGALVIGFSPNTAVPASLPPNPNAYTTMALYEAAWNTYRGSVVSAQLAAPQLERAEEQTSVAPTQFVATDDDLLSPHGECADTGGKLFRNSENWTRQCEVYCPLATGQSCEEYASIASLPHRCFRQLTFAISQEDIESGKLMSQGGFALGNFNYRHDTLAVNVVGTGVKDCSRSTLPDACYAGNFLQFTMHHDGPFRVRNFNGDVYYAQLHPGRIQQARALTAERYLTNPLSGADRGLIGDYYRDEFRGRPLEGNYTIRLYETDGLAWENVEDIQFVLGYRYWTRAR